MKFSAVVVASLALILSVYNYSQSNQQFGDLDAQESNPEIRALIREEVENNPDIVINAIENYRTTQVSKQQAGVKTAFEDLKNSTDFPVLGNKDANVTVVEFFDYNCGACRIMADTLSKSMDDAKFVLVDFPILSPGSRLAAKGSFAAQKIGQYEKYHLGLLESGKPVQNEDGLLKLVESLGIDMAAFNKHYNSDAAENYVQSASALANKLGLNSTPSLIINGRLIVSALKKPQFDAVVQQIKADAKN